VDPHHLDVDPDADPVLTFRLDADPDPDPSFHIVQVLEPLKNCSNRLIFHTFWLVICKLMRIWIRFQIQPITLMRIRIFIWCGSGSGFLFDADADPDADPGYQNDADPWIRIHNIGPKKKLIFLH
jgi:hypothetical protein